MNDMNTKFTIAVLLLFQWHIVLGQVSANKTEVKSWTKPWLWWYWMGSSVDQAGLDQHIEAFQKAGLGGVNITATYGVKDFEKQSIPFMSTQWVKRVNYTAEISATRGMAVDISLGSAWPFGGSNVSADMAAQHVSGGKLFHLHGGEAVHKKVREKGARRLEALVACSEEGGTKDLFSFVNSDGYLLYTCPSGEWDVYALYSEPTGQQVKRAAPGGEGLVLDHFNKPAVQQYLQRFDSLFLKGRHIRSVFNDSYEVYGADYTKTFLDEFKNRRGYDLREHLNLFFDSQNIADHRRILCDYRETISDLLLENFLETWTTWAHRQGVKTVEQAHGSPGNWIDLYAAADIPQTESFGASHFQIPYVRTDMDYAPEIFGRPDKLLMKFASSAAHLTGKPLVSSETATWLGNHFNVAFSQVKPQIDEVFISGINHVMLTCAAYSPFNLDFPGLLFYPACNFGHTSGLVNFMPNLSDYITRCQQYLQSSKPDNEILLYFPMYDIWSEMPEDERSKLAMTAIHNSLEWFYKNDLGNIARKMRDGGFDFDYISDRQLLQLNASQNKIQTPGGQTYKAIVIPSCKRMPLSTLMTLKKLADKGIPVIFVYKAPNDAPGFYEAEKRKNEVKEIVKEIQNLSHVVITHDLVSHLASLGLCQETFPQYQLEYLRTKTMSGSIVYFIANQQDQFREGWITIPNGFANVNRYDPMTDKYGILKKRGNQIYLQLNPGESCFLELGNTAPAEQRWQYFTETSSASILGPWTVTFEKGYPVIPKSYKQNQLESWTSALDSMANYFSGTASYTTTFDLPATMSNKDRFRIELGDVREMAEIILNGKNIGRTWAVPFTLDIPGGVLLAKGNQLSVKVTNLDANRIIWMDKNKVQWQKYFFVDITYGNFNASHWRPVPSGLLGPVKLKCSKE